MKTATNPDGKTIYFEEDRHRYFVGDVVLTPVTTFIDSFFPKFKQDEMARKFAEKHGRKVDDVLGEWEAAKRVYAAALVLDPFLNEVAARIEE